MRHLLSFSCAIVITAVSPVAVAATPVSIGQFGNWSTYTLDELEGKACYMVSKPISSAGKYKVRGEVFAIITHRPFENTTNEFSFMAGYPYKDGSAVTLKIDGTSFALWGGNNEAAFSADTTQDNKIASAIMKGSKLVVDGTSSRGTKTTDSFSLKGSGAAYKAINSACNVTK